MNSIDRETAVELIEEIRRTPDLEVIVGGPDVVYVDTENEELVDWIVNGYKFKIKRVEDVARISDDIIKVSAYKPKGIQAAVRGLTEKFEDRMKIVISGDMWMDAMAPGVSKGQAIQVLQDNLEIKPEETMAFGDQLNDIEMLERSYYSFAVANARDEVKKAARFQADSNVNGGVLKILKLLL